MISSRTQQKFYNDMYNTTQCLVITGMTEVFLAGFLSLYTCFWLLELTNPPLRRHHQEIYIPPKCFDVQSSLSWLCDKELRLSRHTETLQQQQLTSLQLTTARKWVKEQCVSSELPLPVTEPQGSEKERGQDKAMGVIYPHCLFRLKLPSQASPCCLGVGGGDCIPAPSTVHPLSNGYQKFKNN